MRRYAENRAPGRQEAREDERWRWQRLVLIGKERQGEQFCSCAWPNAFSFAGAWGGAWPCRDLVWCEVGKYGKASSKRGLCFSLLGLLDHRVRLVSGRLLKA